MKQEIIIYRTPGEAAIWDWIMNGAGGPVVVWFACLVISIFLVAGLADRYRHIGRNGWTFALSVVILSTIIYKAAIWALTYL